MLAIHSMFLCLFVANIMTSNMVAAEISREGDDDNQLDKAVDVKTLQSGFNAGNRKVADESQLNNILETMDPSLFTGNIRESDDTLTFGKNFASNVDSDLSHLTNGNNKENDDTLSFMKQFVEQMASETGDNTNFDGNGQTSVKGFVEHVSSETNGNTNVGGSGHGFVKGMVIETRNKKMDGDKETNGIAELETGDKKLGDDKLNVVKNKTSNTVDMGITDSENNGADASGLTFMNDVADRETGSNTVNDEQLGVAMDMERTVDANVDQNNEFEDLEDDFVIADVADNIDDSGTTTADIPTITSLTDSQLPDCESIKTDIGPNVILYPRDKKVSWHPIPNVFNKLACGRTFYFASANLTDCVVFQCFTIREHDKRLRRKCFKSCKENHKTLTCFKRCQPTQTMTSDTTHGPSFPSVHNVTAAVSTDSQLPECDSLNTDVWPGVMRNGRSISRKLLKPSTLSCGRSYDFTTPKHFTCVRKCSGKRKLQHVRNCLRRCKKKHETLTCFKSCQTTPMISDTTHGPSSSPVHNVTAAVTNHAASTMSSTTNTELPTTNAATSSTVGNVTTTHATTVPITTAQSHITSNTQTANANTIGELTTWYYIPVVGATLIVVLVVLGLVLRLRMRRVGKPANTSTAQSAMQSCTTYDDVSIIPPKRRRAPEPPGMSVADSNLVQGVVLEGCNEYIMYVSRNIQARYLTELLASHLRIPQAKYKQQLESTNQQSHSYSESVFNVLKEWQLMNGQEATLDWLIDALVKTDLHDLADTLVNWHKKKMATMAIYETV